jgi:hypothetical protein
VRIEQADVQVVNQLRVAPCSVTLFALKWK